jgi:hypothetical protein
MLACAATCLNCRPGTIKSDGEGQKLYDSAAKAILVERAHFAYKTGSIFKEVVTQYT